MRVVLSADSDGRERLRGVDEVVVVPRARILLEVVSAGATEISWNLVIVNKLA